MAAVRSGHGRCADLASRLSAASDGSTWLSKASLIAHRLGRPGSFRSDSAPTVEAVATFLRAGVWGDDAPPDELIASRGSPSSSLTRVPSGGVHQAYVDMQRSCTRTDPAGQVVSGRRSTVRLTTTQTTRRATTMTPAMTHFI